MKVTSGSRPYVADYIDHLYQQIITAGTHKAPSIAVAEAARVIENIQRDVNIALVNELAQKEDMVKAALHHILQSFSEPYKKVIRP